MTISQSPVFARSIACSTIAGNEVLGVLESYHVNSTWTSLP